MDGLLDAPDAGLDPAGVREAFAATQAAFAADLAVVPPTWAVPTGPAVGAHVMVVIASAELSARMARELRQAGYRVTVADDDHQALAIARKFRRGLILVDVELEGAVDGHGVCRLVKSDAALARIPVVLVSSHGSTVDRMAGFALGADDYLTKPVQTVEMPVRVRWMLLRPSTDREPPPKTGGGLMSPDVFVAVARDVLDQGAAALRPGSRPGRCRI